MKQGKIDCSLKLCFYFRLLVGCEECSLFSMWFKVELTCIHYFLVFCWNRTINCREIVEIFLLFAFRFVFFYHYKKLFPCNSLTRKMAVWFVVLRSTTVYVPLVVNFILSFESVISWSLLKGITTLSRWGSLCVLVTPKTHKLAGILSPDRVTHAEQVKG